MSKNNYTYTPRSTKRVPKLRFTEFSNSGEWFKDPLNSVANLIDERAGANEYTTMSITSGVGLISQKEKFGREISGAQYKNYYVIKKWDFAYNKSATKLYPEGYIAILKDFDEGAVPNSIFTCFRADPEKIYPPFLDYLFQDNFHGKWLRKFIEVGARAHGSLSIDPEVLLKMPIIYPKVNEQQKIADCLSSLDDLITAENQKLESLKTHKKGLMQNLFPAEGETIPKLRFKEFENNGDWKPRVLEQFVKERNEFSDDNFPLYSLTIENGVTPKTERYERSFLVNNEENAYKVVYPNDFAFNPMNLRFGAISRHSEKFKVALSKYYNIFYCDNSVDSVFCNIYFRSRIIIKHFDNAAIGSLIEKRRVHFSNFLKFEFLFPKLPEQQKIAVCISSLDDLITAQSQKIEALKEHKKGLVQGLFPNYYGGIE